MFYFQFQTKKAKQEAITSPRNIATFNIRFTGRDLDIETLYDIAQEKFGRPNKPVGVAGLFQFIMTEKQERWPEKKTKQSTPQQSQVIDFETRERLQAELSEKKRTNFYQTFKHGKGDIPSTIQTASSAKHVGDLLSHLGGR